MSPAIRAAKHTPGPWKLITGGPMLVTSDESAIIATRLGGVSEANARLIAAAPELLAALKRATQFLLDNYKDSDMPDILPACCAALAKTVQS